MKKDILIKLGLGFLGAVLCFAPNKVLAHDTPTEISVNAVFLPDHGYDDNDHIVMVVTGELPHICYTLAQTRIEKRGNVIRVHQYAWLRKTGICGTGDADPDLTSPYETEVSLGQLDAGNYEVQFLTVDKQIGNRPFKVAVAENADIDDYAYASIIDIVSPAVLFDTDQAVVTLQGTLNFTCEHLKQPIRIEKQHDVFVVMPIVERDRTQQCQRNRSEFRQKLNLGQLHAGKYVVHARSMSGKAFNRVLDVYPKP